MGKIGWMKRNVWKYLVVNKFQIRDVQINQLSMLSF